MGSAHGWEIYYLTSDPAAIEGEGSDGQFSEQKQSLARQIHEYWTTFAKSGVPSSPHAGGPVMQTTDWFSDQTATVLHGLACGNAEVQQNLMSGCGGGGSDLLVMV